MVGGNTMKFGSTQRGGWKYDNKYNGQDCFTTFLSIKQTYRFQLAVIAS